MSQLLKIEKFLFQSVNTKDLAVYRVFFGLMQTYWALLLYPHFEMAYAPQGMLQFNLPYFDDAYIRSVSVIDLTAGFLDVSVWWWLLFISSVCFTFGFLTRASQILLLVIQTSLLARNVWFSNAEMTVYKMILFYTLFIPLNRELSVDQYLKARLQIFKSSADLAVWPLRFLQLHCCFVYLISVPWKIKGDVAWRNGEAMYYAVINPMWSKVPWPQIFYYYPVTALATYGSLILEFGFAFFVWKKNWMRPLAIIMIFFHLFISIAFNHVGFFSASMAMALGVFLIRLKED